MKQPDITTFAINNVIKQNRQKFKNGKLSEISNVQFNQGDSYEHSKKSDILSSSGFGLRFLTEILDFPLHREGLPTAEKVLRPRKK